MSYRTALSRDTENSIVLERSPAADERAGRLVAGVRIELTTFGLWARRADLCSTPRLERLVLTVGVDPTTFALRERCSTPELHQHCRITADGTTEFEVPEMLSPRPMRNLRSVLPTVSTRRQNTGNINPRGGLTNLMPRLGTGSSGYGGGNGT